MAEENAPVALSLNQAANDFPKATTNVSNALVLVTDGLETCGIRDLECPDRVR
jgi:hypothetical protein